MALSMLLLMVRVVVLLRGVPLVTTLALLLSVPLVMAAGAAATGQG